MSPSKRVYFRNFTVFLVRTIGAIHGEHYMWQGIGKKKVKEVKRKRGIELECVLYSFRIRRQLLHAVVFGVFPGVLV